jgi:hypothetical protein
MIAGAEMFFFAVAAQGDGVRMLAEEQDVGDGAGFAGFYELILKRAGWGVRQEARVYLPAYFFWMLHETVAVSGGIAADQYCFNCTGKIDYATKTSATNFPRHALVIDA